MEKKGNRNLPAAKGSATDSKKNQDGAVGKPWPRGGRRREPSNCTLPTRNEPSSRKPQPQQRIDKRPKPRGSYYGSRNETARLDDDADGHELGSVFLPGSKMQSLNHLLNFSYAPRDGYQRDRGPRKDDRKIGTRKHKYNKEHFLQANCQFVVNDSGDYRQYMNNPDALVDWRLVEQVNVQVLESPSCPICLYPPVAAKMTRCGHIYCWSCILHYLALSDRPSQKCPICYDAIVKDDLKSVVAISHTTFNTDDTITFKLMKRPRGCLTAYPLDMPIKPTLFNVSEPEVKHVYSKLLLADKTNVLSIIERERVELDCQNADDENRPEKCFIEQAMELLEERKLKVCNSGNSAVVSEVEGVLTEGVKSVNLAEEMEENGNIAPEDLDLGCDEVERKFHYFYQAADGQHIYLHAINARMLEHTYGSLEHAPKTITGRILEKEGGSMTEELRRRLRYLQHLPVTCQFEVAEIQLRQPVVAKETLNHFQDQIEARKKKRQRRAKEEKRREKRIEAEENRKMGKFKTVNVRLESHLQFPEFGFESTTKRSESERESLSSEAEVGSVAGSSDGAVGGVSFAAMLASDKKHHSSDWPGLKPGHVSTPPAPVKLINVTGTRMTSSIPVGGSRHIDPEPTMEDYEPVPDFNRTFGDALAQALSRTETLDVEDTSARGKKKKKKQKVLFTTNMAYVGN